MATKAQDKITFEQISNMTVQESLDLKPVLIVENCGEATMYKSPIELIIKDLTQKVIEQQENAITASIVENFGIIVDKDELIKALNYDRGQYNRGYADGYKRGLEEGKKDAYLILAEKLQEKYGGDHGKVD